MILGDFDQVEGDGLGCDSGDCVLIPSGLSHRILDDPNHPIALYGLAIEPQRLAPCSDVERLIAPGKLPHQRVLLLDIERRIRRLLFLLRYPRPETTLSAVAGAIEIFARLSLAAQTNRSIVGSSENTRRPSRRASSKRSLHEADEDVIDEYIHWLDSNFFEQLSIDMAANSCGISRRTFTQQFRARTGKTWLAYLNQLRVTHAVSLLTESDLKVTSVAFQSGFEELSTFYRVFKRETGMRPMDYRD